VISQLLARNNNRALVASLQRLAFAKIMAPRLNCDSVLSSFGTSAPAPDADEDAEAGAEEEVTAAAAEGGGGGGGTDFWVLRTALIEGDREDGLGELMRGVPGLGKRLNSAPVSRQVMSFTMIEMGRA